MATSSIRRVYVSKGPLVVQDIWKVTVDENIRKFMQPMTVEVSVEAKFILRLIVVPQGVKSTSPLSLDNTYNRGWIPFRLWCNEV